MALVFAAAVLAAALTGALLRVLRHVCVATRSLAPRPLLLLGRRHAQGRAQHRSRCRVPCREP
jgi:hypothetical protein